MAATEPRARNLADLCQPAPLDWDDVRRPLEANLTQEPGTGGPDHHTFWLATADVDGRPHMTAVGALWLDGKYYFSAGRNTAGSTLTDTGAGGVTEMGRRPPATATGRRGGTSVDVLLWLLLAVVVVIIVVVLISVVRRRRRSGGVVAVGRRQRR
jgi:Pyridoxamine 5'-phosphate oxidase